MQIQRYIAAGLITVTGIGAVAESISYRIGTLSDMGPGYYPLSLGIILIILGLIVAVIPETEEEGAYKNISVIFKAYCRPWCGIISSIVCFMVLVRFSGLVPATFALIFIAGLSDSGNSLRDCLWLSVSGVIFAIVVFHYGIRIQMPLW